MNIVDMKIKAVRAAIQYAEANGYRVKGFTFDLIGRSCLHGVTVFFDNGRIEWIFRDESFYLCLNSSIASVKINISQENY